MNTPISQSRNRRASPVFGGGLTALDLPNAPEPVFGRDAELEQLETAWRAGSDGPAAVMVWGPVGAGKSLLCRRFVDRARSAGALDDAHVFSWSAASGKTPRAGRALLAKLERFFDLPSDGRAAAAARAERIAEHMRGQRTLLVLDAVEQLLRPPLHRGGGARDAALGALLSALAPGHPGLVILASRQTAELPGLAPVAVRLGPLSRAATRAYLSAAGVHGAAADLDAASNRVDRFPASLAALARGLRQEASGDARRVDALSRDPALESADAVAQEVARLAPIRRRAAGRGAPELVLLSLAGLARARVGVEADSAQDEAAGLSAAQAALVLADPPIPSLADALTGLSQAASEARLRVARARLEATGLLDARGDDDALAAPAAVAAYADRTLRADAPDAHRIAHRRLHHAFRKAARGHPETPRDVATIALSLRHGAAAGGAAELFRPQYLDRLQRGRRRFALAALGAFSPSLAALETVFDRRWTTPSAALSAAEQAEALAHAGFHLRGLGRLEEALASWSAAERAFEALGARGREDAARAATERAETLCALGRCDAAVATAETAVDLADALAPSSDRRITALAVLGEALWLAGDAERADRAFAAAETVQRRRAEEGLSDRKRLYSIAARRRARRDLAAGDVESARDRAERALVAAEEDGLPLAVGLARLTLAEVEARALDLGAPVDPAALAAAREGFDAAVGFVRLSGRRDMLPEALLARAQRLIALHRLRGGPKTLAAARTDLLEAIAVAERAGLAPALAEARALLRLADAADGAEGARASRDTRERRRA